MYEMFKSNPEIQKIIGSKQFPYSEKIMELRIRHELDIQTISEMLDISVMEYLNYEYCDLNIPLESYKKLLNKLKNKLK
jgi:hypothetical protein